MVLVLTQCFTPINYAFAENDDATDFQVEEKITQENDEDSDDSPEAENNKNESEENQEKYTQEEEVEEETINETAEANNEEENAEDASEAIQNDEDEELANFLWEEDNETSDTEIDSENFSEENPQNADNTLSWTEINDSEEPPLLTGEDQGGVLSDTPIDSQQENSSADASVSEWQEEVQEWNTQDSPTNNPASGWQASGWSSKPQNNDNEEHQEQTENEEDKWILEEISEETQNIIAIIKYFFNKEWDSQYIKYDKDSNNIWIITLKDPKNGTTITIMDKNLWAETTGIGNASYGYYFQWWNNHGVKTVDSSNKTTKKAEYKDSYYNRGYDGQWTFIVWSTDYWENWEHYNSLWWNDSKESSRYGSCPAGYHIPTIKEWNQLLSIWWKIHTQDKSAGNVVLRYSADYATKNIHKFKTAATQCTQWDTECVDEDKLSTIIEVLSSELELPLAWSYDENGNFHDWLWVYWTTIAKDGNKAWVFDIDAYIWWTADEKLMYKSQGHSIRCFQNVEPYEAPTQIEENTQEEQEQIQENVQEQQETAQEEQIQENTQEEQENPQEEELQKEQEQIQENIQEEQTQENIQSFYSVNDIPSNYISYALTLDIEKGLVNVELNANWWKFENNETSKTVNYGYYNNETTIDVEALKQDEYRSGYEVTELPAIPVWYKPIDEIESPTREWYIFDGWYTQSQWGEKLDMNNISVLENLDVYAHWTAKEYTITWRNEDGSIRDTTKVAYAQMPTHENPVQPADAHYSYTFAGWEPTISEVRGDAEYIAKYIYTINKYTITWKDSDGNVLKTDEVEYSATPVYNGTTPTKQSNLNYEYTFAWWEPTISEVRENAEYIAKFDAKEIEKQDTQDASTDESTSEWQENIQDDNNIPSWTEWNEGEEFPLLTEEEQSEVISDTFIDSQQEDSSTDESTSEWQENIQDDNNIPSWTEWNEGEEFPLLTEEDQSEVLSDTPIESQQAEQASVDESTSEWQASKQQESETEERPDDAWEWEEAGEEQWFWSNLWDTLKSFFLEDEDGYLRGSETIDDIIVSIEAEEWTFPEGTEVVIKWISQERLESIQTSLIEDESNNVTEDAQILAFDISFVYSGEEIQPVKEVSVKFNYKDNSNFQWSSFSGLSVYHIDDNTNEWEEIEVVNKEWDEIEILATDFSVYVLTLSNNNTLTLTLDPWDWIIITWDNIVVDEYGIWTITSSNGNVTLPNVTRENYVFVWWYTWQTTSLQNFAWNWWDQYHINSDIALYAKWCNRGSTINTQKTTCILAWNLKTIMDQNPDFTYGEIEILRPDWLTNDDGPASIIIMDRNLWATSSGTSNSAWWYYYQYGNNYWFTQNPPTIARNIANVNLMIHGPWNPYYSWNFVIWKVWNTKYNDWPTTPNYNIWWYESDREEDRQWPCPSGWHIPTIEERNQVIAYWTWNNGSMNVPTFRTQLGLPLPWWLMRSDAKIEWSGSKWWFKTVSLNLSKEFTYELEVTSNSYSGSYSENMVNARQIRCFKNGMSDIKYTVIYTDWDDSREIFEDQIFSGLSFWDDFPQFSWNIPSRTWENDSVYKFAGWTLSWSDIFFDVSGATVTNNIILKAKWTWCPNWETENANGDCVPTADTQRSLQIVQDLDIYFLASDGDKKHYTIMDRNMWATGVYNKNYGTPNSSSLGYVYQWWNNYWFPARWDLAQQWVFTTNSQVPKSIWSKWVPSKYSSMTYYLDSNKDATWMAGWTTSDWIWWWTWDTASTEWANTTLEGRQWPCPAGYHVPSSVEIATIFMSWSGVSVYTSWDGTGATSAAIKFSEDFLLPPVWRRAGSGIAGMQVAMSYWSSSPNPNLTGKDRTLWFYWNPKDDGLKLPNDDWRARGRPVRCVKNTVNTSTTAITTQDIHLNGWEKAVIAIDNWVISSLRSPTRTDSTFEWRYTSSDFSWNALSVWNTIAAWSSLYAKFTCNESWYVRNGSECEDWVRLYFDSMWWTEVPSQLIEFGMTWTRPADPTKTWYLFSGWFLTWAIEEFNFTWTIITEETTLYAHWNTWKYEVNIVSNNIDYGTVDIDSVTADYLTPISTNWNELTIWSTTITATPTASGAQYTYTFSGWTFNNCGSEWLEEIRPNCEITANFDRTVNVYTVTWKNYDNSVIKTDTWVAYGTTPAYSGSTPKKPSDLIHAYVFSWWTPDITEVHWDQEYTAVYSSTTRKYDVTWRNIDGTVLETDTNVWSGTQPHYDGSIPTNWASNQYVTSVFARWNPELSPVVNDVEYMARYTYTVTSWYVLDTTKNPINVTLNANGWEFSNNSGSDVVDYDYYNRAEIDYSHSSNYSDDWTRSTHASSSDAHEYLTTITWAEYLYLNLTYDLHELWWWVLDRDKDKLYVHAWKTTSDESIATLSWNTNDWVQGNDNLIVTWDSVLLNFYLAPRSISDVESNWFYAVIVWVIPVWYRTTDEIETPTKQWYTFDGWYTQAEWWNLIDLTWWAISGNMEVFAHWIPNTGTEYTVYHYVKIAWASGYSLPKTELLSWTTDEVLVFSSLAKESEFICVHYSSWSLTWNESWPWPIVTQTTLNWDWSTKIYLYYTRQYHTVTLSGDEHVQMLKINGEQREQATLECGSEVPINAVPQPWYHFVRWEEEKEEEREDEPTP